MKDRSVFKDFKDENKVFLKKCFEEDMKYSKVLKFLRNDQTVYNDVNEMMLNHYPRLICIHQFYAGISNYPVIGMNDFTSWAQKCNFIDGKLVNLATIDRILITTNVNTHNHFNSAERDLNRYEFLEIIIRIAFALYKENNKEVETMEEAVHILLRDNIFPNSEQMDGDNFRKYHLYNVKVNETLKKNEPPLKKLYESFLHSKKKFVNLEECRDFVLKIDKINCS